MDENNVVLMDTVGGYFSLVILTFKSGKESIVQGSLLSRSGHL